MKSGLAQLIVNATWDNHKGWLPINQKRGKFFWGVQVTNSYKRWGYKNTTFRLTRILK